MHVTNRQHSLDIAVTKAEYIIILRALYEYRQDKGYKYHDHICAMESKMWECGLSTADLNSRPEEVDPGII